MALWYHFAIMFEALFILTTIDAARASDGSCFRTCSARSTSRWRADGVGSRGGDQQRDLRGDVGHFLYQGVVDPLGGINSLWPLFGISISCSPPSHSASRPTIFNQDGQGKYTAITIAPLTWLVIVTMTAGWQKLFSPAINLGFLSHARWLKEAIATNALPPSIKSVEDAQRMITNDYVNSAVAVFFMVSVIVILVDSIRVWVSYKHNPAPGAVDAAALKAA